MIIADLPSIFHIVKTASNVAIIGASTNTQRTSYQIAKNIIKYYRLFLVNPRYVGQNILGEPFYHFLKDIKQQVDIVDIFRNPDYAEEVLKDSLAIKARVVWFQPGSENIDTIKKYQHQIDIIYGRCLAVVSKLAME